jgi:hypothetical protein
MGSSLGEQVPPGPAQRGSACVPPPPARRTPGQLSPGLRAGVRTDSRGPHRLRPAATSSSRRGPIVPRRRAWARRRSRRLPRRGLVARRLGSVLWLLPTECCSRPVPAAEKLWLGVRALGELGGGWQPAGRARTPAGAWRAGPEAGPGSAHGPEQRLPVVSAPASPSLGHPDAPLRAARPQPQTLFLRAPLIHEAVCDSAVTVRLACRFLSCHYPPGTR